MFKEIKILLHHGIQFVPNLQKATLPELFRGRPVIHKQISETEELELVNLCPTKAFSQNPFVLNLGKCIFCKECQFAYPHLIHFTNDYKIACNTIEGLKIKKGDDHRIKIDRNLIRPEIKTLFKHAIKLRQVSAGGDNSCEWELNASGNVNFDMGRHGIEFVASPRHADGIVITGPITENMAEALQICYDAIPSPKIIILVGTEAINGGIYQTSNALDRSFLEKYPVDLFIPGNPTHPLTFINGILDFIGKK